MRHAPRDMRAERRPEPDDAAVNEGVTLQLALSRST
jgi:hypothetical protein